jgi:hypothetical protein
MQRWRYIGSLVLGLLLKIGLYRDVAAPPAWIPFAVLTFNWREAHARAACGARLPRQDCSTICPYTAASRRYAE